MFEGKIPTIFVENHRTYLAYIKVRIATKLWTSGIIAKILRLTHRQWLLRNAKVNIKWKGDLAVEEHDKP